MVTAGARSTLYQRIYAIVREIPAGRVATYGQIAFYVHRCTARQVGYALSALTRDSTVPWHRVINRDGEISERSHGGGESRQRKALEAEGVFFDQQGRVAFSRYGWSGPPGADPSLPDEP